VPELSIFIDESGHFDSTREGYYVLSLVLREQRHSIATEVAVLDPALTNLGFADGHVVHSGAAIRGEEDYRSMDIAQRKAIFTRFLGFARRANITYQHFVFRKKDSGDALKLEGALARQLGLFLREHAAFGFTALW
jgi:prepilin-type processing-associated H-X9-DG protein